MSLSKLPRELILTISDTFPTTLLASFLRTCQSLHELLKPALISRITTDQPASTILRSGIEQNNLLMVHLALTHNAAWHTCDESRHCYSALEHACDRGYLDIAAALITHFGDVILTDNEKPDGRNGHKHPLENAIQCNELVLTTFLLDHGAAANRPTLHGYPRSDKEPLDFAAKYASVEIVVVLIVHGARVHAAGRGLRYALVAANWGVVEVLLREGVFVRSDEYEWSDLFPLGGLSPDEIAAWVGAARKGMCNYRDGRAWKVGRGPRTPLTG